MGTFKRTPFEIDTSVKNGSKYLNQMQFNGIVQNNNIFDVDQNSLTDALNVYVNEQNILVSREPLISDNIEIDYPTETALLIDIKECNGVKIFVFKDDEKYTIIAYKDETSVTLNEINKYYLTIFNQYIICWNDLGAKVIDTNSDNLSWNDINKYVEIPIVKITAGSDVQERENNYLTNGYKKQYIITAETPTALPDETVSSYIGEYLTSTGRQELTLSRPWELSDLKLIKRVDLQDNLTIEDIVTISNNTICIGKDYYFLLSTDCGNTFIRIAYPEVTTFRTKLKKMSEDGKSYFYITDNKLWCCDLTTFSWIMLFDNIEESAYINSVIKNQGCFAIQMSDSTGFKWYFKFNESQDIIKMQCGKSGGSSIGDEQPYRSRSITISSANEVVMFTTKTAKNTMSIGCIKRDTVGNFVSYFKNVSEIYFDDNGTAMTIRNITKSDTDYLFEGEMGLIGGLCYKYSGTIDSEGNIAIERDVDIDAAYPVLINSSKYITTSRTYIEVLDIQADVSGSIAKVDDIEVGRLNNYTISTNEQSNAFVIFDKATLKLYTNMLNAADTIIVTYVKNASLNYVKQIPTISYSGSELYLVFDNTLMITKNMKNGEDILFNLPKINNQSFGNSIKSIINISTTELAIFFENGITICTQVSDDLTGYRYDYAKTRLTLGTKFSDSVINTADGASTLYATPRGLAIMNYQAYMATTDQTLQFVSDKIYAIWNKFYLSSENITLVQHGDYVFVYNTSNQYLMLDLRNYSWWKFEIPFNIKKLVTDQIDLRVISDNLYKFKQTNNDTDKIEDDYVDNRYYDAGNEPIRWMFISQRLHFNLPNHYKNMKQLVFHLIQSTGQIATFNAQVNLYRNSVSYKDMEVIPFDFKIDEFRTFVKRFNYWKINLLQYGIANDDKTAVPARLVCNGIDIKYEIGDEVR